MLKNFEKIKNKGLYPGRPRNYECFFPTIIFIYLKKPVKQDINLNPNFFIK